MFSGNYLLGSFCSRIRLLNSLCRGATVLPIDLDEIVYPGELPSQVLSALLISAFTEIVKYKSLRPIVTSYNRLYGSYAFHIRSYVGGTTAVTSALRKKSVELFDFSAAYAKSKPCQAGIHVASWCSAKYIYRSLNINILNTHEFSFIDETYSMQVRRAHLRGSKSRPFTKGNSTLTLKTWLDEGDFGE